MSDAYHFDTPRFRTLLLEGAQTAFQALLRRYADEHIYNAVLCLSADFDTVQPGINTEAALTQQANSLLRPLIARGRVVEPDDLRKTLRYSVPEQAYRAAPSTNKSLASANALLAELSAHCAELFESEPDESDPTPCDNMVSQVLDTCRAVLRELDSEGLFGVDADRERIVLDLCWFTGGMPDAYQHLDTTEPPAGRLNPPAVQQRYHEALLEARAISRTLFGRG